MPAVKNHTVLDDEINMKDESKISKGNKKHIIWQTSINNQRTKLRVHINNIITEGLLDTDAYVSIITSEYGVQIGHFKRQMFNS